MVLVLPIRQRQVIDLTAEGKSAAEIAQHLRLSKRTVEMYRTRAMLTLGARNSCHMVALAAKAGLLNG